MGALLKTIHSKNGSGVSNTTQTAIKKAVYSILILMLGLLMLMPFIFMISASFKYTADVFIDPLNIIPKRATLNNYITIFHNKLYFRWYMNSFIVVISLITLRTFVVSAAAYAFARLDFKGKGLIFMVLLSTLMVPGDMTIISRFLLLHFMRLTDSLWALILPGLFDVFFLFLLRQFFMTIPKELSEAAFIDGCSHYRIYGTIILPLAKPAIITMALFTFIWSWNDFIAPFIFITDINKELLTVGLQYFRGVAGDNTALQMAGACVAILPTVVAFTAVQKYFVQGVAMTGIKG